MNYELPPMDMDVKIPNPYPYLGKIAISMAAFYTLGNIRKNAKKQKEVKNTVASADKKVEFEYYFYEESLESIHSALIKLYDNYLANNKELDNELIDAVNYALLIINTVKGGK